MMLTLTGRLVWHFRRLGKPGRCVRMVGFAARARNMVMQLAMRPCSTSCTQSVESTLKLVLVMSDDGDIGRKAERRARQKRQGAWRRALSNKRSLRWKI